MRFFATCAKGTEGALRRELSALRLPLAFLIAGLWWWYVRDSPAEHPGVSREELALIDADRPTLQTTMKGSAWRLVLKNREVLLLTASYFCSNYVFYLFFNWLFIYLVDSRGFKVLEGGYYAAAPWIAGAAGALAGGAMCDRLSRRVGLRWGCRVPSILGLALTAGFILAAANAGSPYVAVLHLSLCLGCQQMTEGPFWAATIAVSGRHAAAACGVLNTGGNVVGGIGALLVPLTVQALGWGAAGLLKLVFAAMPVHTPWAYAVAAEAMAVGVGLVAGVLPAYRAARLDPIEALRGE